MAKTSQVIYGVSKFIFAPASTEGETAGQFPDFTGEKVLELPAIAMDSFTLDRDDDSVNDIYVEQEKDPWLHITTQTGAKTLTLQTYDNSPGVREYFLGAKAVSEASDPNNGWLVEDPSFELPLQAIHFETLPVGNYKAMEIEFMPVKCTVKDTGTVGRSGLTVLEISMTVMSNHDKDGKEIANGRRKELGSAASPSSLSAKSAPKNNTI